MTRRSNEPYKLTPLHPGEHLHDYLEAQGMSPNSFAQEAQLPLDVVEAILSGEAGITREIAVEIECIVGGGAGMWMNINDAYYNQLNEGE